MKNIEYEEASLQTVETGDKEGTYEQKKGGDQGDNTVFMSTQGKKKVTIKEKSKEEESENIIFAD